jgi:hypothetical protein
MASWWATIGSRQAHLHPDEPVAFSPDACGHMIHPHLRLLPERCHAYRIAARGCHRKEAQWTDSGPGSCRGSISPSRF